MELTMAERKTVTVKTAQRYRRACRREKKIILDEFTALTGYNRKYAITVLANEGKTKICTVDGKALVMTVAHKSRRRRVYKKRYDEAVRLALVGIWKDFDYQCGQRLAAFLKENVDVLAGHPNYSMEAEVREKLKTISASTIDRLLRKTKRALAIRGTCGTKATTRLNRLVPVKTHFECAAAPPGYFQVDLVFHDGGNASGEFCYTLTITDVATGWTMRFALLNKAHKWVREALDEAVKRCPFAFAGMHSDNGSEFLNSAIYNWCKEKKSPIAFSRSRKLHKNDNCWVEQKNNAAVRRVVGYQRYEGQAGVAVLQSVYDAHEGLFNFFYPCMKLIEKQRLGSKVTKRYDKPKTPFQRLLEHTEISQSVKLDLITQKAAADLVALQIRSDAAIATLWQSAHTVPALLLPKRPAPRRGGFPFG